MFELSISDIDRISRDVKAQDISLPHLADELIDHICSDVENEMLEGLSFSDAYRIVKKKMGPRRIKEIQEETLYMIDTKYRNMKNAMKISGITGTILYGFSVVLKLQHWPGAGILMTIGSLILGLVFMPSALTVLWKETRNKKRIFTYLSAFLTALFFIAGTLFKIQHWPGAAIWLTLAAFTGAFLFIPALVINRMNDAEDRKKRPVYIIGAAGLVFYMAGMLFKIMHWPMAVTLMLLGMILLCILAFPLYTYMTWKEETHVSPVFLYMIIGALLVIIPGALVNLNLQRSYEEGFYLNQDQQQKMQKYLYDNNTRYLALYQDSLCHPLMQEVRSSTDLIMDKIDKLEAKLINNKVHADKNDIESHPVIGRSGDLQVIDYDYIDQPFRDDPVKKLFLPGTASRDSLDKALFSYSEMISSVSERIGLNSFLQFPDISSVLPKGRNSDDPYSVMSGLHSLESLKNTILTVEGELLSGIADSTKSN
jgi:hypothetical protein